MDEKVIAYLLGELSEAEEVRLEEEYFADEEGFQQLQATQNDLFDAYTRGKLTPRQSARFEEHWLRQPWQNDRAVFASVLAEHADRPEVFSSQATPAVDRVTWWQRLKELLRPPTPGRWALATAMAGLVLALGGGIWLVTERARLSSDLARQREHQQDQLNGERDRTAKLSADLDRERQARARLEQELARLQQPPPTPSTMQSVLSFVLVPVGLRDRGQLSSLRLTRQTQTVRLRLTFSGAANYPLFLVTVRNGEDREITTQRIEPTRNKQEVEMRLRAASLKPDDYTVTLSGRTVTGEVEAIANYSFRVTQE